MTTSVSSDVSPDSMPAWNRGHFPAFATRVEDECLLVARATEYCHCVAHLAVYIKGIVGIGEVVWFLSQVDDVYLRDFLRIETESGPYTPKQD